jgi:hypothetical protein
MVDATISRARLRDLTAVGRSGSYDLMASTI